MAARRWLRLVLRTLAVAAAALVILVGAYLLLIRPWHIRWGATLEEVARAMPGDELFPDASLRTTRAITIRATPERIWPWLVQMGNGGNRGGWYSYDRLDNGGRPSATRIIPELQGPIRAGDRLAPPGAPGFVVMAVEPNRFLVLGPQIAWTFGLYPQADGTTRLVERLRARYHWRSPRGIAFAVALDFGDFIMMRKQLLNLKARVEGTSS